LLRCPPTKAICVKSRWAIQSNTPSRCGGLKASSQLGHWASTAVLAGHTLAKNLIGRAIGEVQWNSIFGAMASQLLLHQTDMFRYLLTMRVRMGDGQCGGKTGTAERSHVSRIALSLSISFAAAHGHHPFTSDASCIKGRTSMSQGR
jgi:hypothetical protein